MAVHRGHPCVKNAHVVLADGVPMTKERKVTKRDKRALFLREAHTEAHAQELKQRGLVICYQRVWFRRRARSKEYGVWSLRLSETGEMFAEAHHKEQTR